MHDLVKEVLVAAKWLAYKKNHDKTITASDCLEAIQQIEGVRSKLHDSVFQGALKPRHYLADGWKDEVETLGIYSFSKELDHIVNQTGENVEGFAKEIVEAIDAALEEDMRRMAEEPLSLEDEPDADPSTWIQTIASASENLKKSIIGQPHAIEAVCDGLMRKLYRANANSSLATFLFIGPSATGKSLLANKLADALGGDWKKISVQMETMLGDNQGFPINGLSRGYGTATPGLVTDFVRRNPRSVVVFENFDKAHSNVRSIVEGLLTTGKLTDQHGFYETTAQGKYDYNKKIAEPEVSFHEAIVIFTTNSGEGAYDSLSFKKLLETNRDQIAPVLLDELGRQDDDVVNPELSPVSTSFLSSLASGTTVFFEELSMDSLIICAEKHIRSAFDQLKHGLGCTISCASEPLVSKALLLSFCPNVNALTAGNALVEKLVDPVLDFIRNHEGSVPQKIDISISDEEEETLNSILKELGDDPLNHMFRKNLSLSLSFTSSMEDKTLRLSIGGFALQQISHSHDFQGVGAIQVEVPEVSFDNIAGHHVVKKRLFEIVKMLKNPKDVQDAGVDVPKGMLLWGPPGTGKTLLAKALAHEADLPFIATTGSELLNRSLMQSIFKRARKYAPSILFIDEIDAVGARGMGGNDVVINQLLIEIDGFDTSLSAPVFIVAATNLPEKIDPAVLRSGRIDLKVNVPMLDKDARGYFVDQYFELPHDGSLNRDELLNYTSGMSGADLEKVKRETTLAMFSSGHDKVSMAMLVEQINTIKYGVRLTHKKLLQSLQSTAYHEAGHAIVSLALNPDMLIEQVTVMPRANALGFVSYDPESIVHRQMNRKEVLDTMSVALAGRIAQSKQFPEHGDDSGASSDLQQATRWALHAIYQLGLDEKVGHAVLSAQDSLPSIAEGGMALERVQAWLDAAEKQCCEAVEKHWNLIDQLAKHLIEEEVVTGEALRRDFSTELTNK